jgi:chromosome segregation ATPase
MVSENDDFSFGDLKGQIAKFKTVQAAHNEKLDSTKTELEQKKALCEQIARELESLESEICQMEQRKLDLDRTIQEADKAFQRIQGSTVTLANVIESEMARCHDA